MTSPEQVLPFLALNGGSSSLKYAYFPATTAGSAPQKATRGSMDRIGSGGPRDHADALAQVMAAVGKLGDAPRAVGHRLVHGGAKLALPTRMTDEVLTELRVALPFAPLHLPPEIAAIEAVRDRFGSFAAFAQIVCFDTAFHRTLPEVAYCYALPEAATRDGVRRYGFHGLSYEHVVASSEIARRGKVVVAHLGSGSSLAAVEDGVSLDTTMGLTPTGGVVMGTRPGDLDPGVLLRILRGGSSVDALETMLNQQSGLKALSGGADMKAIVAARASDPRAKLAFDIYTRTARKHVLAMAASLGGLDAVVFTGGIGEHAPEVRAEILRGTGFVGIELDEARNAAASDGSASARIDRPGSRVAVEVVPTDEEERILVHAGSLLGA